VEGGPGRGRQRGVPEVQGRGALSRGRAALPRPARRRGGAHALGGGRSCGVDRGRGREEELTTARPRPASCSTHSRERSPGSSRWRSAA
jgi:hypothetical protein